MENLAIKPAAPEDVPVLHSLILELAEFEKLSHEVVSTEAALHDALFGDHPAAESLLAVVDDEPAGFALFFQNYSTFAGRPGIYLEDLYVKSGMRRRGIGRALFLAVNRIAAERKCGRFEWCVLDWNSDAIDFYESLGARIMTDWRITRLDRAGIEALANRG